MNEQFDRKMKELGFERYGDFAATAPYFDYDRYVVVDKAAGAELKQQVSFNADENYWYGTLSFSPSKDDPFDVEVWETNQYSLVDAVIEVLERETARYLRERTEVQ